MNWQQKARIQNLVARLPMADAVYYAMQRTLGSLRRGDANPTDWYQAAIRMASWIRESGRAIEGKRFIEVGTGRNLNLPTALWISGADRVTTVDLNAYLSRSLVFESIEYANDHRDEISKLFEGITSSDQLQQRFDSLVSFDGSLDELLAMMNVEYIPGADATRLPLADASFDYHVSYAVFEHIPRQVISGILAEARRILRPGGLVYHVIDPSDHFSHDDPSITAVNFLRFGQDEWDRIAGNKFTFHNRLRSAEFFDLFRQAGVNIIRDTTATDEPSLKQLQNGFPLHADFAGMTSEELAIRGLIIMGEFEPK